MAEPLTSGARDAAKAADLLVTVAETLNQRLAVTTKELARSQALLRESSAQLMTAFRGAADRLVAAQQANTSGYTEREAEYGLVLEHLYRAVHHLQSHDLVDQLIDAQKVRVGKMREKLEEALSLASPPVNDPQQAQAWIERSRLMLNCIVEGIRQIDDEPRTPIRDDRQHAGSVDIF